ncbi:hypothetical protein AQZ52_01325 [Novosphingobium fuchskuhlense]|uniref:Uncharacterized protein n=1 Tax=Novosphingobium fuchskuhlense TaxID=1117702 RepID=A0A124JWS6_9SPHN|nr:hypothetical protein AQZ52_01325 [Novosphingobium fuchskuhlense]
MATLAADAHRMMRSDSNFAEVQRQLLAAARRIAEARGARRAAPDNTTNWRSARWLWPLL